MSRNPTEQLRYLSDWLRDNTESPSAGKLLQGLYEHAQRQLQKIDATQSLQQFLDKSGFSESEQHILEGLEGAFAEEWLRHSDILLRFYTLVFCKEVGEDFSDLHGKRSKPHFRDLRGVHCPMNFVKCKLELSRMQSGELLTVLLDDGPPIENVPRSLRLEGHKILERIRKDKYWEVVIRKISQELF